MDIFNNREIASAVWLTVFLVWILSKRDFRRDISSLFHIALKTRLWVSIVIMGAYVAGSALLLSTVKLWDVTLVKDTILWFCFGAMALVYQSVTAKTEESILKGILADNFKVIVLYEFLINTYTFSLPTELIFLPLLALIVGMNAYAKTDEKYASASKVTHIIIMLCGFFVLYGAIKGAIADWQNLGSFATLKSVALVPLLSLLFVPFLYAISLYSMYEQVFVRLEIGREKTREVKRYAKKRIMRYAGLHREKLLKLLKSYPQELIMIATKADVDRLIDLTIQL